MLKGCKEKLIANETLQNSRDAEDNCEYRSLERGEEAYSSWMWFLLYIDLLVQLYRLHNRGFNYYRYNQVGWVSVTRYFTTTSLFYYNFISY